MKIAYEPHPVSRERKNELRDAGFRIVDVKFKPQEASKEIPTRDEIEGMGRKDVVSWLEAHGVDGPKGATPKLKAKLAAIIYADFEV